MRAGMHLRGPTTDGHICPTACPTPHGSARSMLPLGADSYGGAASGLLVRVPTWASQAPRMPAWGLVYPPHRALRMGHYGYLFPARPPFRGPFTSPSWHLRLGDDVAPGAPATSVTYPDILTSMDAAAAPALEPTDTWTPWSHGAGAPSSPTEPTFQAPGLTLPAARANALTLPSASESMWGPLTMTQWLYVAGGSLALILLLKLAKRR